MVPKLVLLTPFEHGIRARLKRAFSAVGPITVAADLEALRAAAVDADTMLLSIGSGVIVPAAELARFSRPAYNLHAATPDFPGRDPHHHAVYRGATTYGATLHVMTAEVDAGPIVAMQTFPVPPDATPNELLAQANEAGLQLIERLAPRLLAPEPLPALEGATWGSVKTTRADFHRLCALTPLISEAEFHRRARAFDHETFENLTVELHGRTFRSDRRNRPPAPNNAFAEFTEEGFRRLLHQLQSGGYRFARYNDASDGRHVIWRHDVDFSMHRAVRLAEIEAEEGVVATYFVNPRCTFYNLLEPAVAGLTQRLLDLGHNIGLHFDAAASGVTHWTAQSLELEIRRERQILEVILQRPVTTISWHNPDLSNLLDFEADEIGGLRNAYSATLRRDYVYASDSNGYWRFKPMSEVIAAGHPRLHLLTHPAWWTPEPMAPSARIDRAILGRARAIRQSYDAVLRTGNRKNLTN
jgi:hypothetical protein